MESRSPSPSWWPSQALLRRFLDLATQLADGIARALDPGIVHRDLKALERLGDAQGARAQILDFGLSTLRQHRGDDTQLPDSGRSAHVSGDGGRNSRLHLSRTGSGRRTDACLRPVFARMHLRRDADRPTGLGRSAAGGGVLPAILRADAASRRRDQPSGAAAASMDPREVSRPRLPAIATPRLAISPAISRPSGTTPRRPVSAPPALRGRGRAAAPSGRLPQPPSRSPPSRRAGSPLPQPFARSASARVSTAHLPRGNRHPGALRAERLGPRRGLLGREPGAFVLGQLPESTGIYLVPPLRRATSSRILGGRFAGPRARGSLTALGQRERHARLVAVPGR